MVEEYSEILTGAGLTVAVLLPEGDCGTDPRLVVAPLSMTTSRVAVIGGGAAGMLAALRAIELGADVTLHERADVLGGSIRTVREGGWLAELGANTLMEPDPVVRGLLDRAGLADRVIRPSAAVKRRYIVHEGVPVTVPGSASALLATALLSVPGRLRLLKEPFVAPGPQDGEESVDAFARRRFGDEVAERFLDPLLAGTSGADPTQVLVRYVLPKLFEYEQLGGSVLKGARRAASAARAARTAGQRGHVSPGLWSCPDGLGEIPRAVGQQLGRRLRLGHPASVCRGQAGLEVRWGGEQRAVDAVIVAVPTSQLPSVAGALPGGGALAVTATMPLASIVSLSLGFRRDQVGHPLDGFGLLAPSRERRRLLGVLFPSTLFADRAPAGHVLVSAFVGGMRQPELVNETSELLERVVREELAALLEVRGEPLFRAEGRWIGALPQAVAGHGERLAAADAVERANPMLAFAGNWRDGLSVGDAMLGGVRAVDRLAERCGWMR